MRETLEVICIVLMLCFATIVIMPNKLNVKADSGSQGTIDLDTNFIYNVTEYLSNIIYTAYDDGELHKGRAFGSKGEH